MMPSTPGVLEVPKNIQELSPPFSDKKHGLSFDSFRDDLEEQDELFFGESVMLEPCGAILTHNGDSCRAS